MALEQGEIVCGYHHFLAYGEGQGWPYGIISQEDVVAKSALIAIFDSNIDIKLTDGKPSKMGLRKLAKRRRVSPDISLRPIEIKQ